MSNNELNLADFQKIIFLNNIEESSEISDINNIFKYGEDSNEKFDFAVFFTEHNKSDISNLDNAEQYPNKIINIWNKGQRLNRFIGIDKLNNQIITVEKTYKLLFSPNDGLISVIDQKKVLSIIPSKNILLTQASLELREVNSETQALDPIPENLHSKIKWLASNSDIALNPPNGDDNTLCKIKDSVKTYGKFTLNVTLNGQPVQFSETPDKLSRYTLTIKWNSLNAQIPNCHSSHIFSTDITATLTGYQTAKTPTIQLIKDAVCPSSNEIKVRIIEADKEYAIPGWDPGNRTSDYTGNLQLTNWSLKPGTYNITTIAPVAPDIENGNGSLKITVREITPILLIGLNSASLTEYNASTNNTISKTYDGTALYATVSIEDPTNHLRSISRQFNGTITYWEDGKNIIHEVQYIGTPIQLTGVSITTIDGNKNFIKLHVQFTPNRNDNTYIYYGAIQNAEITLQLNQKPSTLTLTGVTTTYDGTNYYIKGKPSVNGTIYYKEYTGNNIPNKEDLKRYGFIARNAIANRYCDLSDIHPISVCTDHIAAYLDPDDDSYDDSSVVTADIVINKANTSLVFNGSSDVYDGNKHGLFDVKITANPAVDGKLYYATSANLFTKFSSVTTSDYNGTTATVRVNLPFDMQQTNVGDYTIYVKFIPDNTQDYNESTVNGTFSITQANPTLTISNYSANYNGSTQGFIRVTPLVSGEVYYGLSQNNQPYHIHASRNTSVDLDNSNIQVKHVNTSSPQIIYIHLEPDDTNTYNNSNIYTATITIKKAKPTLTLSSSSIQYSNTANKASATVTGIGTDQMTGTIYYVAGDVITSQTQAHQKKYNNAAITLDNVSQTDAGSIKLTAQFVPSNAVRDGVKLSDDYDSSDAKSITITVTKAPQSAPTASGDTKEYPNGVEATASGGGQQGSLIWVNGDNDTETSNKIPANTAPTSKNVRAYWSGNNNYEPSPKSNTVTIEITKRNTVIPSGEQVVEFNGYKLIYDGDTKVLVDTTTIPTYDGTIYWYVSTSSTQPLWSTAANSGWSLGIPSKIEPGTYYVWYYIKLNTDLYNAPDPGPGTFYNTVTKVTETSTPIGGDGYETGHKTIYKSTPTIKINGNTVTSSPVIGYTGTYNENYQGSFTFTPSVKGYGDYDKGGGDTPGYINTTNANQTVTVDVGNELCIKYAGTHPIYVYFHPSDTAHYYDFTVQVNIIINPKKLDKPVLTAVNATWAGIDGGAIATVTVKPYKVYMNGAQREPDIEFYYRLETSSSMKTSSSAPRLNKPGWMRVRAIYKNSTNGVVDNNWVSSDESDLVEVYMYRREVTITPPEFTASELSYTGKTQNLIKSNTGSCTAGGTMYYYLSKNNATTPTWSAANTTNSSSGWSTNIPTATDGGTYYVWWVCYVSNTTYDIGTNINTVNRISGSISITRLVPNVSLTFKYPTYDSVYPDIYGNQVPTAMRSSNIIFDLGINEPYIFAEGPMGFFEFASTDVEYHSEFVNDVFTSNRPTALLSNNSITGYIGYNESGKYVVAKIDRMLEPMNGRNWPVSITIEGERGHGSSVTGPIRVGLSATLKATTDYREATATASFFVKDMWSIAIYKDNNGHNRHRVQLCGFNAGSEPYQNPYRNTLMADSKSFNYYDFEGFNTDIKTKVNTLYIGTNCTKIANGSGSGLTALNGLIIASTVQIIGWSGSSSNPEDSLNVNGGAFTTDVNLENITLNWRRDCTYNSNVVKPTRRYICGNTFTNSANSLKRIYIEDPIPPICSDAFLNMIKQHTNIKIYVPSTTIYNRYTDSQYKWIGANGSYVGWYQINNISTRILVSSNSIHEQYDVDSEYNL